MEDLCRFAKAPGSPNARIAHLWIDIRTGFIDTRKGEGYQLSMEEKPKFLIYSRKEALALLALGLLVAAFSFTLGVHWGKQLGGEVKAPALRGEIPLAESAPDGSPGRQELEEKTKDAEHAADSALSKALHDEVTKTGLKMDAPHQVELPKTPRPNHAKEVAVKPAKTGKTAAQASQGTKTSASGASKYTIQIGSYVTEEEAEQRRVQLEPKGLQIFVREAEVEGKGVRFRVFFGTFPHKQEAEKAGRLYVQNGVIENFVVVLLP